MWHHWLQHVQLNQNGETLLNLTYHYRPAILATAEGGLAGQVSRRVDNLDDASSRSYAYDALGRLVLATGGPHGAPLWTQRYGYDFWGNRTTTTATGELGSSWEIPDGQRNLAYDESRNQITSNGVRYDAAGNQLSTLPSNVGSGQCQYDAAGRLAVVRDGLGKEISRFVYGACNRRRATVSGEYGWTRYHVWDGDQVIAGYETPAGAGTSVQWRSSMVFLGPRLLAHQQNLGATWWTLYEHPGLIGTAYVTGPDVHDATLAYLTSFGGNNDATPVRAFASYSRDRATGLDYAVNRYYDSGMGRFLQPDPLGSLSFRADDPQSLNLYAYCANDPISRSDPLGLLWQEVCTVSEDGLSYQCEWWDTPEITIIGSEPDSDPGQMLPMGRTLGGGKGGGGDGRGGGGGGMAILRPPSWFDSQAAKALLALARLIMSLTGKPIQRLPKPDPKVQIIRRIDPISGPPEGGGMLIIFVDPSYYLDPCGLNFWGDPKERPARCLEG
jgi:RHS repeat-associated protein